MVVSSSAYQDAVNCISTLFNANVQIDSQNSQNSSSGILQAKDEEHILHDLVEAKILLLQSIDPDTKVIKNLQGLVRVIAFADQYVNEYWDVLPEQTKVELFKGTKTLLDVIPDVEGNIKFSKISPIVREFLKNPVHNTRRCIYIVKKTKDNRILLRSLGEKLYNFAKSVQKLAEKDIERLKPTSTVGQILDWVEGSSGWEGDDFEECLEIVINSRSQARF